MASKNNFNYFLKSFSNGENVPYRALQKEFASRGAGLNTTTTQLVAIEKVHWKHWQERKHEKQRTKV